MLNIDTTKSYATEENLIKAISKLGFEKDRPLVVCNREGRFTAVFGLHLSGVSGDPTRYARHGFMTID